MPLLCGITCFNQPSDCKVLRGFVSRSMLRLIKPGQFSPRHAAPNTTVKHGSARVTWTLDEGEGLTAKPCVCAALRARTTANGSNNVGALGITNIATRLHYD